MQSMFKTSALALAALAFTVTACEDPPAPPKPTTKTPSSAATPKTPEKPKAKQLTAQQKADFAKSCWAAFDAKDEKKGTDCFAANATASSVDHLPPQTVTGNKKIWDNHQKQMMTAFPDLKHELGLIIVNGNNVITVASAHGKNSGEMMGKPGTDKEIGVIIAHHAMLNAEAKVQRGEIYSDQNTMMSQLGLTPPEAAKFARPLWEKGQWGETKVILAKNDETEKDNLAAYNAMSAGFNAHDVDKALANYADDVMFRHVAHKEDMKGLEAVKKGLGMFFKTSSDVKSRVLWSWAAGDYVVAASQTQGTHDGDAPHMKATNKKYSLRELEVLKYEGGEVKEHWLFSNSYKFAVDIGVTPDPSKMAKGDDGAEKKDGETKPAGAAAPEKAAK